MIILLNMLNDSDRKEILEVNVQAGNVLLYSEIWITVSSCDVNDIVQDYVQVRAAVLQGIKTVVP